MTIALNMIMKNEEKVLPRFLESVYRFIDYYVINDTGSTDNSKKIVKEFFESKNIKGEIHDFTFENFEVNRNFALEKLKGKADYGLIIDADEELILGNTSADGIKAIKRKLNTIDSGYITCESNNVKFNRLGLFRVSKPFYWKYPIHNLFLCKEFIHEENIPENVLSIKVRPDGNTWTSQTASEKYEKSAQILIDYINKNCEDSRCIFYIGKSYMDGKHYEKALHWFKKRIEIRGANHEEIYYSQLMISRIKYILKTSIPEVEKEYIKCGELDKLRAEHLYDLKLIYEANKIEDKAKQVKSLLSHYKNPYPQRQLLLNSLAYAN